MSAQAPSSGFPPVEHQVKGFAHRIIVETSGDREKTRDRLSAILKFAVAHPDLYMDVFMHEGIDFSGPGNVCVHYKSSDFNSLDLAAYTLRRSETPAVFISAGNTGDIVSHLTRHVGRIGKLTPSLCCFYPKVGGRFILSDVGGGSGFPTVYDTVCAGLAGRAVARGLGMAGMVATHNVGAEVEKGGDLMVEINRYMREVFEPGFYGNCEPHTAILSETPVVVLATTGFEGNTILKTTEAVMELFKLLTLRKCSRNPLLKLVALLYKKYLLGAEADWRPLAGAYLTVGKPAVKTHGRCDEKAMLYSLERAADPRIFGIWELLRTDDAIARWSNRRAEFRVA